MSSDPDPPVPAHTTPAPVSGDAISPAVEPYEPAPPAYGKGRRAMFAFVAVMCFVMAAILFGTSLVPALAMVGFGGIMAYFTITGKRPDHPELAPASPRFQELADPARPLTSVDLAAPQGSDSRVPPEAREKD